MKHIAYIAILLFILPLNAQEPNPCNKYDYKFTVEDDLDSTNTEYKITSFSIDGLSNSQTNKVRKKLTSNGRTIQANQSFFNSKLCDIFKMKKIKLISIEISNYESETLKDRVIVKYIFESL